jgi:hypothetical protein
MCTCEKENNLDLNLNQHAEAKQGPNQIQRERDYFIGAMCISESKTMVGYKIPKGSRVRVVFVTCHVP